MTTILDRIVDTKRKEVQLAKQRHPQARLEEAIESVPQPRDFISAVTAPSPDGISLIAEIKKSSPSAGTIVDDFDAVRIARTYHRHGAAAISVLTDAVYFGGHLDLIAEVKDAVPLPVLRKDFIVEEYQVYESRAAGADAVLLIVEVLGAKGIAELWPISHRLGMATLIEVHSPANLSAVLETVAAPWPDGFILGINNRDLSAQRTILSTTTRLAQRLPPSTPFIAESGIATRADVLTVQRGGACAVLVGESLLRADDIGAAVAALLGR